MTENKQEEQAIDNKQQASDEINSSGETIADVKQPQTTNHKQKIWKYITIHTERKKFTHYLRGFPLLFPGELLGLLTGYKLRHEIKKVRGNIHLLRFIIL
ncbi:MAG: hypothetical protein HYR66_10075 [Sphingobacteriales bacterium]|nr:hypothetical protein [Sphingobacteriales bacterium]MBI3720089.1 hypothetical protein [Sphingobacteriales bacterium]